MHVAPLHDRDERGGLARLRAHDRGWSPASPSSSPISTMEKRGSSMDRPARRAKISSTYSATRWNFCVPTTRSTCADAPHQLRPAALRHAAEKAEDHLGPRLAQAAHHAHFADRLLLRHVAHGAGVQQHHVGVVLAPGHLVAAGDEHPGDLLGVALIHLAAVGFDEDPGHGGGKVVEEK